MCLASARKSLNIYRTTISCSTSSLPSIICRLVCGLSLLAPAWTIRVSWFSSCATVNQSDTQRLMLVVRFFNLSLLPWWCRRVEVRNVVFVTELDKWWSARAWIITVTGSCWILSCSILVGLSRAEAGKKWWNCSLCLHMSTITEHHIYLDVEWCQLDFLLVRSSRYTREPWSRMVLPLWTILEDELSSDWCHATLPGLFGHNPGSSFPH